MENEVYSGEILIESIFTNINQQEQTNQIENDLSEIVDFEDGSTIIKTKDKSATLNLEDNLVSTNNMYLTNSLSLGDFYFVLQNNGHLCLYHNASSKDSLTENIEIEDNTENEDDNS